MIDNKNEGNNAKKTSKDYNTRNISNYLKEKKIFLKYYFILSMILFTGQIFSYNSYSVLKSNESYITLKIQKSGKINIFCSDSNTFKSIYYPDKIYINNKINNTVNPSYDFQENENTVKLVWSHNINYSHCMFSGCSDITEIDLSHFDASDITGMSYMFRNCSSLTYINFTNFHTSAVRSVISMFYNCLELKSLDLSSFDTSNVVQMGSMFYGCGSLRSLDLSNFNTSNVEKIDFMFSGCKLLNYLKIDNFNTSKVKDMSFMFRNCESLTSLNISNFDTSKVNDMSYMFCNCTILNSLNISNFDTSKVEDMRYMFYGNLQLISLDLSKFNTSNVIEMDNMFNGCSSLINLDLSNFNTSLATNISCMFYGCKSLLSINISSFDTSKVIDMRHMFCGCSNLTTLDLSNFNTTNVLHMLVMFHSCSSLKSLDLSNFNTSNTYRMGSMFKGCSSLIHLNLSNFDTSNDTMMDYMFYGCYSLKSLDISKFKTPRVKDMQLMFYNCTSLTSLDFSNFDTSRVTTMQQMFYNCTSLSSLNLSSFQTPRVNNTNQMFYGCNNLEYINLPTFNDNILINYNDMFYHVPDNLVVCINETNSNKILEQLFQKNCLIVDCSNNWKSKQRKIVNETGECVNNCTIATNKYEFNGKCFKDCQNDIYEENDIQKCKCPIKNCRSCSPIALKNELCSKCNQNYYPIENDPLNLGEYINCYENLMGYYLDLSDSYYKKCYYTCSSCKEGGNEFNHNCQTCNDNYNYFKIQINNYYNCYNDCPYYHYIDEKDNTTHCTLNLSCTNDYPKLLINSKKCIKNDEMKTELIKNEIINIIDIKSNEIKSDIDILKDYLDKSLEMNNKTEPKTKEQETEYYKKVFDSLEDYITSGTLDTSNIDQGKDINTKIGKVSVTFTSKENQKLASNSDDKMVSINLGQCEKDIRGANNIPPNETLYMKNLAIEQEGMKIPKMEFDIYRKINNSKLIKLSKSACKDSKISLSVPIELKEDEIDKLNTSSEYFNNICYQSTSDSGTDIILGDRKKDFIEGNKTICQDECDFALYNKSIGKANCSCDVKETSNDINDMNIDKNKLEEKLKVDNGKKISNLALTSCNVLSSKENIEKNTGFYLLLIIWIIFIIIFIIFVTRGYNLIKQKFEEVIYNKFDKESKKPKRKSILNNNIINKNKKNKISKAKSQPDEPNKKSKKVKKGNKEIKRKSSTLFYTNPNSNKLFNLNNQINNNINSIVNTTIDPEEIQAKYNIKPDTDYEFNWLVYEDAMKFDKRESCDYYGSLLKQKQLFIFTFCSFNDYNSGVVKKFILFLSFALHYTVNALFFNEATMHQIYIDQGQFNFSYQFPFIISSTIISTLILRLMLQFLVLTDKDVLQVKLQATKPMAINMKNEKLKCIKIKFIIFFAINFILLGLFWYYLTSFNAIYQNAQVYLIENTFISFGFSLFYPFIINIIPTILRSNAIHSQNKDKKYLYRVSQIIQII